MRGSRTPSVPALRHKDGSSSRGSAKAVMSRRKIAATLASTGTPAQFVHPVEASHGDLGMIGSDDAILALSNSGETSELADIVAYSRRFEIPLIAITGGARSTLAEAADIVLLLPSTAEACPMGLAPTTSTTMMMALGDALAIALLERKGFSSADFQLFHPGGRLGRRLLRVRDIMHTKDEIPLVSLGTRMSEAILVMTAKSFGCVGVCDSGGCLIGVITDGDLRRHMGGVAAAAHRSGSHAPQPEDDCGRGSGDGRIGIDESVCDHLALRPRGRQTTDRFSAHARLPAGGRCLGREACPCQRRCWSRRLGCPVGAAASSYPPAGRGRVPSWTIATAGASRS